ncbi:hypothetical protein Q8A73_017874 [Channa argus]|nr:hypothetical protein Q8A73_017874 [Channa argus]
MEGMHGWRRSVRSPDHLPSFHPLYLLLSPLVSMQSVPCYRSSLHWSTSTPLYFQGQVEEDGVNICSWRRPSNGQMAVNTKWENSSLWPGILKGRTNKRRGGDEDGRIQTVYERVKEGKEGGGGL